MSCCVFSRVVSCSCSDDFFVDGHTKKMPKASTIPYVRYAQHTQQKQQTAQTTFLK